MRDKDGGPVGHHLLERQMDGGVVNTNDHASRASSTLFKVRMHLYLGVPALKISPKTFFYSSYGSLEVSMNLYVCVL